MFSFTLADIRFTIQNLAELQELACQECFRFDSGDLRCVREYGIVYLSSGKTRCLVTPGELSSALENSRHV